MKLFCIYLKLKEVPEEIRRIEEGLGKYRKEYETKFPDENLNRSIIIYADNADVALIKFQVQHRKYLDLYDMNSIKILPVDIERMYVIKMINGSIVDSDIFRYKINSEENGIIFWDVPLISSTSIFDMNFSKLHAIVDEDEKLSRLWVSIDISNNTVIESEFIDTVLWEYQTKVESDKIKEGAS